MKKNLSYALCFLCLVSLSYIVYYQFRLVDLAAMHFIIIYRIIDQLIATPCFFFTLAFLCMHSLSKKYEIIIAKELQKMAKRIAFAFCAVYLLLLLSLFTLRLSALIAIVYQLGAQSFLFFLMGALLFLGVGLNEAAVEESMQS